MKRIKYLEDIVAILYVLVLTVWLINTVLNGYYSGQIELFSKYNHEIQTLKESPETYWRSLVAWAGVIIVFIALLARVIVRLLKRIKDS